MITEFLITVGLGIGQWFVGLFPTAWNPPAELVGFDDSVNSFIGQFGGLGVWAPWTLLIACAVASVGVWVIGLGIKAIRAVVAHVPMIGGAG